MKNKPSEKHHYLPRHYLERFTDPQKLFYVFDKENGAIFQSNPNSSFFQKKLNTITFPNGDTSDLLESMYKSVENVAWGAFNRIVKSTSKEYVSINDRMMLFFFLLFLYWRLPSNAETAQKLSQSSFAEKGKGTFDYFNLINKDGSRASQEVINKLKEHPAWQKTFKTIIPFVPFFHRKEWIRTINEWRFLYPSCLTNSYLVSDKPIIATPECENDPTRCLDEFIFPVSGRILLINYPKFVKRSLDPEFILKFNTAVIHRAQRFVAHCNKQFLEYLIERYNLYMRYGKTSETDNELFEHLENPTEKETSAP